MRPAKFLNRILLLLIGAILPALLMAHGAAAEPLRLGHPIWVGFGPMYIAQEKGYFKKHGLEVELIPMEDTAMRYAALRSNRVDALAASPDSALLQLKGANDFKFAFMLDQSYGADGVVALKEIATLADLRGHTVGVTKGSITEYWLNYLLRAFAPGVKESDLKVVDMTPGDAGAAFVAKKIDAAVTYEPWLTRAAKTGHGHVIIDSKKTPARLGDVILLRSDYAQANLKKLKGFAAAWDEALAYMKSNPEDANAIMARGVGGWLKDPKVFADVLTHVNFFDGKQMQELIGTRDKPGAFRQVVVDAIDIWSELGRMPVKDVKADDLVLYEVFH
jgi:NitT/TauT family transport system substrate-binding protein